MSILDLVFLVILFIAFISGMQKGLLTSLLACVAMFGAFLIAEGMGPGLAKSFTNTSFYNWVQTTFNDGTMVPIDWNNWFNVLSFIIVFILAYAALMLVVNLINNVFRLPKLKVGDSLLGGVLGLGRGYVVICITVAAMAILLKPIESEGSTIVNDLIDKSPIAKFFRDKSLGDVFGIAKYFANLK